MYCLTTPLLGVEIYLYLRGYSFYVLSMVRLKMKHEKH